MNHMNPAPLSETKAFAICVGEADGHLFVTLWLPAEVLDRRGTPVDVVGFNDTHESVSRDDVLRSVGAALVAACKGERLP